MCSLLGQDAHLCKTTSSSIHQKHHLFDPQTASIRAIFVTFVCSCRSIARSVRYVFASCPLQKQPVARLPCFFSLQAPCARTTVCIALAILWNSYAICCFLYAFHALHTPVFQFCVTLFEKQLPAFVGKHDFENSIKTKSCPEELPRPPRSHGLHLFWGSLSHLEFAKSLRKSNM